MIKTEIVAALCLALLFAGGFGVWYEHHAGYVEGRAAQVAADHAARRADAKAQAAMVARNARDAARARRALRAALASLAKISGACVARPMPASVLGVLRRAGIRTAAPGAQPHAGMPGPDP